MTEAQQQSEQSIFGCHSKRTPFLLQALVQHHRDILHTEEEAREAAREECEAADTQLQAALERLEKLTEEREKHEAAQAKVRRQLDKRDEIFRYLYHCVEEDDLALTAVPVSLEGGNNKGR